MSDVIVALESRVIHGVSRCGSVRSTRGGVVLITIPHRDDSFFLHLHLSLSIATLAAGISSTLKMDLACAPCFSATWKNDLGPQCGPFPYSLCFESFAM